MRGVCPTRALRCLFALLWFLFFPLFVSAQSAPVITRISPTIAPFYGTAFTLTVTGQNFDSNSQIAVGANGIATTFTSSTQLTGIVPASALISPGTLPVKVGTSNSIDLKVVERCDLNANRTLSIGDALVLALTVGNIIDPPLPPSVGDCNLNGVVNIGDALVLALFAGGTLPNLPVPAVNSVSPDPVGPGQVLTINGSGFSATAGDNRVLFTTANDSVVRVTPSTASFTQLTVTVPNNAVTGPIQVYRSDIPLGGTEFGINVNGSATPLVLTSVSPISGVAPGSSVTLRGMGFDPGAGNNTVKFRSAAGFSNGTVTSAATGSLSVTVPQDAVCGEVWVEVGTLKSNARAVLISGTPCVPRLVDYYGAAAPGETLVLEGTGWSAVSPGLNIVTFAASGGTVTAPVLSAGRTQLHVRVPDTAIEGTLSVSVNGVVSTPIIYRPATSPDFPSNRPSISSIFLLDPATAAITSEVLVKEGSATQARLRIVDNTGATRTDTGPVYSSANPEIATVDALGNIQGRRFGFSTITVTAGNVIANATITVVQVQSALGNTDATGIAQDQARRLYVSSTARHTILSEDDLTQPAQIYAGTNQTPGLVNDLRLQSLFRNPSFIAFDQATATLYVSDSGNNVIRRVRTGADGRVDTLAGTGVAGSQDGTLQQAAFNNPQGLALDSSGNLWVADSGNNTIRRIKIASGMVETIAGSPGASGTTDGSGNQARFSSPLGIAVLPDSLSQQSGLLNTRGAPPSTRILVADSASGRIRRVSASGQVETIAVTSPTGVPAQDRLNGFALPAPATFNSPTAVAADSFGDVLVTESGTGSVKMILPTGDIVSAAPANTFTSPKGITVTQSGRILIADSQTSAQEIRYGEPAITSITPPRAPSNGSTAVTIVGSNFAPGTTVLVGGVVIAGATVESTQRITFTASGLPSGLTTVTVQNRGGIAQRSWVVDPQPLSTLAAGQITTIAGGGTFVGDGGTATSGFLFPWKAVFDSAGNIYVSDSGHNRIRKINATTGIITTIAGTGDGRFAGDGGSATAAALNSPQGLAIDGVGNLYVADTGNHRVRKIEAATGNITTLAGDGNARFFGDGGQAASASLATPSDVAADSLGNIYVADSNNSRIRKINSSGVITTVAGNGQFDFAGDGGPAVNAVLNFPQGIAVDRSGILYIADTYNGVIRKIAAAGTIATIAGTPGTDGFGGDNNSATAAVLSEPAGLIVDAVGNLFIADTGNHRVRRVDVVTSVITSIAGTGQKAFSGDNGPAVSASLAYPTGVAVNAAGDIYIADLSNLRLRRISVRTGIIATVGGNQDFGYVGDGGPATAAGFNFPQGVAFDSAGNMYIADTNRIRKVSASTGIITTIAGTGQAGYDGDGGPAVNAQLFGPAGMAIDSAGNIFVADADNNRIRKIAAATGIISTIAGTGAADVFGDNGPAISAALSSPLGVALDTTGANLYVSDTLNGRIRKINFATGIIATVASGFGLPIGIAFDSFGNLYVADTGNSAVLAVTPTGNVVVVAGTGIVGFSGDGGSAAAATLSLPIGVAVDGQNNLFIADTFNARIRKVEASTGIIRTIAGNGDIGFSGDSRPATDTALAFPEFMTFDRSGNLVFADPSSSSRIRVIKSSQ